jgi:hypothetical protein
LVTVCGAGVVKAKEKKAARKGDGFRPLFDGVSLKGWTRKERELERPSLGIWTVEDGVIVGGQDPPGSGLGSYLVTDEAFGDFELQIEARPDWRADTGILVRTVPQGNVGIQCLLDHRPHGGIGGYYGNGNELKGFRAWEYQVMGETDKDGRLVKLTTEKPDDPPQLKQRYVPLDFMAPPEVFLRIWKVGGWNHFRIRCVGEMPHLTTWINGEKFSELDTAKIQMPGYDPKKILEKIGTKGHIALEVHANGPKDPLGKDRWAPGAVCRWRNISIKTL